MTKPGDRDELIRLLAEIEGDDPTGRDTVYGWPGVQFAHGPAADAILGSSWLAAVRADERARAAKAIESCRERVPTDWTVNLMVTSRNGGLDAALAAVRGLAEGEQ